MVQEIKEIIRAAEKVGTKFPLEFAVLFGSRARGDYLKNSDFDILFVSKRFPKDIFERLKQVQDLLPNNVEPICYTLDEFEENLKGYNVIVWEALRDGKPLLGANRFERYTLRFEEAKRKKEIIVSEAIRFVKEPSVIFG